MDKSPGTNLHLWRFFKSAKQTVTREFIYTWSAPPPSPPPTMLDTCTRYFVRVSTLYEGGGGGDGGGEGKAPQFKTDNSAFFKLRFENTKLMQVSKGVLSSIVAKGKIKTSTITLKRKLAFSLGIVRFKNNTKPSYSVSITFSRSVFNCPFPCFNLRYQFKKFDRKTTETILMEKTFVLSWRQVCTRIGSAKGDIYKGGIIFRHITALVLNAIAKHRISN